ncbi:MAG: FtsX-like permease family protein [Bacteroidetes bacterium]|nr:FtsX-like permease family protein [Bacteroidota bacterium]
MYRHYLKSAIRNLLKHKGYSLINILGLSIGLACGIMILLFIRNEFSYDRFHDKHRNLYRVNLIHEQSGQMTSMATTVAAVGPSMLQEFPEVVNMTRISNEQDGYFSWQNRHFFTSWIVYADSSFFEMFSFRMLVGNPINALTEPFTVVLSEKLAGQIFGSENPVGRFIRLNNQENLLVTGVVENPPPNSSIRFNALISFTTLNSNPNVFLDWDGGYGYYNFVELSKDADPVGLAKKFPDLLEKNINYKYKQVGITVHAFMQPIRDLHLRSNLDYDTDGRGSLTMNYIFLAIALFILVIACINFMNLATARSVQRAKEVGLRKVVGAERKQIIRQFLGESVTASFIALAGALILIEVFQPEFNRLINSELHLFKSGNLGFITGIFILTFTVGLAAGSYPSFFMAGYQPLKIIKGDFNISSGKPVLRNVLVVFQFFISSSLILFTLLVFTQLQYISQKNLGYDKENVIYLTLHDRRAKDKIEVLKTELRNIPGVISTGASTGMPGHGLTSNGYFPEGYKEPMMIHALDVDYDYLDVMKIPVIAGRNFSKESATDAEAFLINKTLAMKLNWNDPVGKKIYRDGAHPVIGMIDDFHFSTLHEKIEPLLITLKPWDGYNFLAIRLSPGNPQNTLHAIERKWNEILPGQPYSHVFLDSFVENAYDSEGKTGMTFLYFSLLAVFIACLGLFGLANFSGEQKRKEIGIRKVYGANSRNILTLLSSDFTKWVIIANILAWPLAYWAMDKWLQLFEFRTNISIWIFVITFCLTSVISSITILYQLIHASRANPIETIKYE